MSQCVYMQHECAGTWGGQKRALNALKLELQVVVSLYGCLLGMELSFK